MLSVVIPCLNAAATLPGTVAALAGAQCEVVVADGGSTDGTAAIALNLGCRVVVGARGRGEQLAAGIAAARGAWLLLLHADTRLGPGWDRAAFRFIAAHPGAAGYFRFVLDSADWRARRLERLVAWRCRVLHLPYGDQGLLVARDVLDHVGGVQPMPLMEDVDLVRRLARHTVLIALDADAVTSPQRWEREGWLKRSIRNLSCLTLYFLGVAPHRIARLYS